jgi:hypothetical protein
MPSSLHCKWITRSGSLRRDPCSRAQPRGRRWCRGRLLPLFEPARLWGSTHFPGSRRPCTAAPRGVSRYGAGDGGDGSQPDAGGEACWRSRRNPQIVGEALRLAAPCSNPRRAQTLLTGRDRPRTRPPRRDRERALRSTGGDAAAHRGRSTSRRGGQPAGERRSRHRSGPRPPRSRGRRGRHARGGSHREGSPARSPRDRTTVGERHVRRGWRARRHGTDPAVAGADAGSGQASGGRADSGPFDGTRRLPFGEPGRVCGVAGSPWLQPAGARRVDPRGITRPGGSSSGREGRCGHVPHGNHPTRRAGFHQSARRSARGRSLLRGQWLRCFSQPQGSAGNLSRR